MNISEITLGGYSVADLKKMQQAVQKDANKFVADNLAAGIALVQEIVEDRGDGGEAALSDEDVLAKAEEAANILEAVDLVADISGVTYYLDWTAEWQDDVWSAKLEDCELPGDIFAYGDQEQTAISRLFSLLASMESDSQGWHDSTC